MPSLQELEADIKKIKERNERVEADKAWETSGTRKLIIAIFTYFAIGIYLWVIGVTEPWLNAIVPTVAFMLSTLTIPIFKKLWIRSVYKKH
jgi:hypothetical protein